MNTITALERYYRDRGILSTSFTCPHRDECSAKSVDFTGPKSAFVSTGYERGDLPRLLFISLDSGSGDKNDEQRLPVAVSKHEEFDRDFGALARHKHWYRTHELAWYILRAFRPSLKLEEARRYFAHANSAKCCMNKAQRKKADSVLFRNCRHYLRGELEVLNPQIIVTQGSEAKLALVSLIDAHLKRYEPFAAEISIGLQRNFWLHTYHPSCWGRFNKQRAFNKETGIAEGWERYSKLIWTFAKDA
jgi:hypothetical protein